MASILEILPLRTADAAENMATDFLLLQHLPSAGARPLFRHYHWRRPAFTFGYSQKIAEIRTMLPGDGFALCRRPTGGGLVDHRDDWTYTVIIPRGHPLEEARASESYRAIHQALADALSAQRVEAVLQTPGKPAGGGIAGACFVQAEPFDVVHGSTGAKIAGAAQKRTKRGLLFQGSVSRNAAGTGVDWERFHDAFASALGRLLGASPTATPFPELSDDELSQLTEHYASPEWTEAR